MHPPGVTPPPPNSSLFKIRDTVAPRTRGMRGPQNRVRVRCTSLALASSLTRAIYFPNRSFEHRFSTKRPPLEELN